MGLESDFRVNIQGGEELAELLIAHGIKVGILSGLVVGQTKRVADSLGVPLFDKDHIVSIPQIAKDTLYWGPKNKRERL